MNFIGISINHKTAPVELREALHLSRDEIMGLIPKLKSEILAEGVLLSTCNRTEIYGLPKSDRYHCPDLQDFLLSEKPVKQINSGHFQSFFSCGAIKHLFYVASGLGSQVLGDSQILGQVKESFQFSEDMGFAGLLTRRIFTAALRTGKRAIKETLISEGAVTVSFAAIQVVEKIFSDFQSKKALIIGAGETGELAAVHLKDKEIGRICITNRTRERAEALADKIGGCAIGFSDFKEKLHEFDIIITATSSPDLIIDASDVKKMMKKRRGVPVCIMDIAVPRDVDAGAANIENVFYHDIDSLNIIIDKNLQNRRKEVPKVESIVMEEMNEIFGWYNSLDVVPTIRSFRTYFEKIKDDELEKIRHKVTDEDFAKIEDMSRRLIGRLMHYPTITLKELAETGQHYEEVSDYIQTMKNLFKLDDDA
jgi:glutamyl-tRNA reductase